jgi:hypothetical protein
MHNVGFAAGAIHEATGLKHTGTLGEGFIAIFTDSNDRTSFNLYELSLHAAWPQNTNFLAFALEVYNLRAQAEQGVFLCLVQRFSLALTNGFLHVVRH